jgi:ribosomal-protein-alanine acetyltransferase
MQNNIFNIECLAKDSPFINDYQQLQNNHLAGHGFQLVEELARPWAYVYGARRVEERGQVAGMLLVWKVADELHILSIVVEPNQRRQGIAQSLLEHVRCVHSDCVKWVLEVRRSNTSAIALYRKLGFYVTSLRTNYYEHPVEDAVNMLLDWDQETGKAQPIKDEITIDLDNLAYTTALVF